MDVLSAIPGNYGWPVVGNTFRHFRDPIGFKHRMRGRYGDVYRNYVLFRKTVVLLGEDANREVLANKRGDFSNEGGWGQFIGKLFPGGLMLMDGDRHRAHRQTMNPDFTRQRMEDYSGRIGEAAAAAVASNLPRRRIDVYPFAKHLSLEIALDAFFGIGPDSAGRAQMIGDLSRMVAGSFSLVRAPVPGTRFAAAVKARGRMVGRLAALAESFAGDASADHLFPRLVREADGPGAVMSRRDVVEHMLFLVMASHDTTASAITSSLYFLARHPEWQARAAHEARSGSALDARPVAEAVVKEALRLYPPVPELPRTTTRDVELFGHFVPAGTRIGISPSFTHYMDDYWVEPTRFDPGRFLPGRFDAGACKYRYVPFRGGVHHCLGFLFGLTEARIVVSELLRRCDLGCQDIEKVRFRMFPFPHPRGGFMLDLAACS